jgi:hypothetical protein
MIDKMSTVPSPKVLDEWYEFIFKLFNEPRSGRYRSAQNRFLIAQSVFDRLRFFFSDLTRLLVTFEYEVKEAQWVSQTKHRNAAVDAAKKNFIEARKLRKVDRGEFKLFADALLLSITDVDEARFYNAVAWFFQYSDSVIFNNPNSRPLIIGPEEDSGNGARRKWDSASGWLASEVFHEKNPKRILANIELAKFAVTDRFTAVISTYNDLQLSLGCFPKANSV